MKAALEVLAEIVGTIAIGVGLGWVLVEWFLEHL